MLELEGPLFAFLLTLFAGLSTGIGSLLGLFTKKTNRSFLAVALGFSAGVMIYVSFVDIFLKAFEGISSVYGDFKGYFFTTLSFFGGIAVIAIIDRLVPENENPHEIRVVEDMASAPAGNCTDELKSLKRSGLLVAISIMIHNFPEGMVTFFAALTDPIAGVSIAIAIAIHNIPEGIAISVPVYYATGSRKKAFFYSFLSGLSEPVGALIGYLVLRPFLNEATVGVLFAMVAGVMVFISLDELLPAAQRYGKHHLSIYGFIGGMAVMATSLILLF